MHPISNGWWDDYPCLSRLKDINANLILVIFLSFLWDNKEDSIIISPHIKSFHKISKPGQNRPFFCLALVSNIFPKTRRFAFPGLSTGTIASAVFINHFWPSLVAWFYLLMNSSLKSSFSKSGILKLEGWYNL